MKIYCPEFNLASSVFRNMISDTHTIVDSIEESDFALNLGRYGSFDPRIFSINPDTSWLELDKHKAYEFFSHIGVNVPTYKMFQGELPTQFPFVVKFITPSTLGPQTVVVKTIKDYNQVIEYKHQHDCDILIQDYVEGREFTVTVLVGNKNWIHVGTAKDFKKLNDNDTGVNTYGMASISPVASNSEVDTVINAVIENLNQLGTPYRGFLSFQFIESEKLWLLECNVRLCMPEFQSMSKLLDSSLCDRLYAAYKDEYMLPLEFKDINSVTINLVHKDFPYGEKRKVNFPDSNLEIIVDKSDGKWSNDTYIAGINAYGNKSIKELSDEIYSYIEKLYVPFAKYRKDIT